MVKNFTEDLMRGKTAETAVYNYLSLLDFLEVENVSDNPLYYNKGDFRVCSNFTTHPYYIDAKNDSRVAQTRNILCEEEVYFKETDEYKYGDMYKEYDYLAVVSMEER